MLRSLNQTGSFTFKMGSRYYDKELECGWLKSDDYKKHLKEVKERNE